MVAVDQSEIATSALAMDNRSIKLRGFYDGETNDLPIDCSLATIFVIFANR